ncbi:MAG: glycoside hydrolase family 65 protein [Tepidibacillus sp.]
MKQFQADEWKVIEDGLHLKENRLAESMMSLGNGHMGMRGNFEEDFSGDSLQGTYVAGVYYPDKTRVGWWKNGYPEYFAKVLNATNFIGIQVEINGQNLDLAKANVKDFKRELNMKHGYLLRSFTVTDEQNRQTQIEVIRFLSIDDKEIAVISYRVTPLNYVGEIKFTPYLDSDVRNEDANYDEKFWLEVSKAVTPFSGVLTLKTKKLDFLVTTAMKVAIDGDVIGQVEVYEKEKYVSNTITVKANANKPVTLFKYVAVTTNRDYQNEELEKIANLRVEVAYNQGFNSLFQAQQQAWESRWKESDIVIEGDIAAQQGIRFNIFQLYQTYDGEDPRLNIGPKGFTGEKYGGSTYWDTEAYCLPFYLSTSDPSIARNLLIYRYNHLEKAKENAAKLGLKGALYPMVTMNGEECHNEWEITFEEIHRNGAIAHAIYNYVNYTGDQSYLSEYGFEVLAEISRFWADRVNYQPQKDVYMILGVTGPNEYENNVNNNWYTNRIASWTLEYTLEVMDFLKANYPSRLKDLIEKLALQDQEIEKWKEIIAKMYYPIEENLGIFLQQDGYLDKVQLFVKDLPKEELPLNQHWSWDRILRSCFIKQADVLQGLYFLNDQYTLEQKKNNFDFYEPRTVHESSLSPCVHSILAAEIGYEDKAYELYLRTARLDLDNYNNDTDDGLHITSMAGSWLSIVHGFAGMRVRSGMITFKPFIPKAWEAYSFKILFRGHLLKVSVNKDEVIITQEQGQSFEVKVYDQMVTILENNSVKITTQA